MLAKKLKINENKIKKILKIPSGWRVISLASVGYQEKSFKPKKKFYKDFSLKEKNKNIIDFERIKKLYDEYLEFEGFPQVVLEERSNRKKQWLQYIFKSYFEKDVQTLTDFKNISIFQDLLVIKMALYYQQIYDYI